MKTLRTNEEGYGYKYTDMAEIHRYLEGINASYYQYIETLEGNDYIMTVPIIDGKELAPRRGCRVVQATLSGKSNPAQEHGSALTYARRYSLLMAFGLATEDDDAESLTEVPTAKNSNKKGGMDQSCQKHETLNPIPTTAPQNGYIYSCSDCGDGVTSKVAEYSKEKFGKVLCYDCQKNN